MEVLARRSLVTCTQLLTCGTTASRGRADSHNCNYSDAKLYSLCVAWCISGNGGCHDVHPLCKSPETLTLSAIKPRRIDPIVMKRMAGGRGFHRLGRGTRLQLASVLIVHGRGCARRKWLQVSQLKSQAVNAACPRRTGLHGLPQSLGWAYLQRSASAYAMACGCTRRRTAAAMLSAPSPQSTPCSVWIKRVHAHPPGDLPQTASHECAHVQLQKLCSAVARCQPSICFRGPNFAGCVEQRPQATQQLPAKHPMPR